MYAIRSYYVGEVADHLVIDLQSRYARGTEPQQYQAEQHNALALMQSQAQVPVCEPGQPAPGGPMALEPFGRQPEQQGRQQADGDQEGVTHAQGDKDARNNFV